jgi:pyruvate dehydrogenase E2 component (dihydrolipoamide acetyltransferase)
MAEIVKMPKLSDTMTDGVVAEWHKKVGDVIESGELLAEIETDKATMEFESFQDGVLLHIGVEKGGSAPVDSVLAILGEKGEDITELLKEAASAPVEEVKPVEKTAAVTPTTSPAPVATPQAVAAPAPIVNTSGRLKASPLAKKLAAEKGLNLAQVPGSGDSGRVVKRDVEHFVPASFGSAVAAGTEQFHDEPVSQMRKVIARRLAESKFSAPHFYLNIEVDMENAVTTRRKIIDQTGVKFSLNDLIIKASAEALKKHPAINAGWHEDFIRYNEHVHVGVAVAVPDGLLVPVIRFADTKKLSDIGNEVRDLAGKAKDKKLQPAEWEGNTFTISNLGMFGIDDFTAIINPPDSCILAVGQVKDAPVVKNGAVVPGKIMKLTLSCDHRVVDGASGAAFLQDLKMMLENPMLLLV